MLRRLKKALVESFVGTIALGWLLAQGLIHFAYIFIGPLTYWTGLKIMNNSTASQGSLLENALVEAGRSFGLLLLAYILLRWLYYVPVQEETPASTPQV